jgi:hypothetical protein
MERERIAGFIDYALSQRNNHGISEAVGLFTIGLLFPHFRNADEWRRTGRDLIVRQIGEQMYEDGSYIQHSFNYQRVMLDDAVWAFRLAELNEQAEWRFGAEFCSGAKKDANAFRSATEQTVSPLICGPSGVAASLGYYRSNARESYAMLRAARYRDRPSQPDQLHFDLWWRGENIACDAGTYLYHGPPRWDNALGATWVHNTVTVGGRDQMTRGRFLWLDWAQAQATPYSVANQNAIEAWHDGDADLAAPTNVLYWLGTILIAGLWSTISWEVFGVRLDSLAVPGLGVRVETRRAAAVAANSCRPFSVLHRTRRKVPAWFGREMFSPTPAGPRNEAADSRMALTVPWRKAARAVAGAQV